MENVHGRHEYTLYTRTPNFRFHFVVLIHSFSRSLSKTKFTFRTSFRQPFNFCDFRCIWCPLLYCLLSFAYVIAYIISNRLRIILCMCVCVCWNSNIWKVYLILRSWTVLNIRFANMNTHTLIYLHAFCPLVSVPFSINFAISFNQTIYNSMSQHILTAWNEMNWMWCMVEHMRLLNDNDDDD